MNDWDMKATGCQRPSGPCCGETAPQAYFEASLFEAEGGSEIGLDKDGSGEEALFQPIEGVLFRFSPLPGGGFLGEIVEGSERDGVVMNEPTDRNLLKPRNARTSLSFAGVGQSAIPLSFNGVHSELAGL